MGTTSLSPRRCWGALAALIREELGYTQTTLQKQALRMLRISEQGNCVTLVAVQKSEVCGFIGFCQQPSFETDALVLKILALAVKSKWQNKGCGSALIFAAQRAAVQMGCGRMTLSSSMRRSAAHVFYERKGFCKSSYTFKKEL